MGYVLPVRSYRYEHYANVMLIKRHEYADIEKVSNVKTASHLYQDSTKQDHPVFVKMPMAKKGLIFPNPAHLSSEIAKHARNVLSNNRPT
ncbi:hypothetical protein [Sporosarcina sp. HYO08]|uniref:hypothetical protein n=1 Tax=Sporosarcina sp. HYO08 TaxID=1759557 RepID=UPI000798FC08|nr:hypothetical protein [Sporosarcina sp. HYO08]KXH79802.1 hypothetical protein AU377_09960 [Sporosarcina sp. HYO08]